MEKTIEIPEGYETRIESNKVVLEPKENEDEKIRTRLIALVEAFGQGSYKNEMLAYLERQKEQKPAKDTALQEAFINSKIDYTLEEKCDASDYAEIILPTSVIYGENEEEYKLHKIIEAAFIAGQKKEQQPAEWSDVEKMHLANAILAAGKEWGVDSYTVKFLESLRPSWKPSEEQMKALDGVLDYLEESDNEDADIIRELINDLKKL